jgi:hypothetical protein
MQYDAGDLACLKCGHLLRYHSAYRSDTLTGHGCQSFGDPTTCMCANPVPGWAGRECERCHRLIMGAAS